jgi:hypothetical protein
LPALIGRRVRRNIEKGEFFQEADIEALELAGATD